MPFSYVSQKSNKTYYLHSKVVTLKNTGKQQTIYFFSTKSEGGIEMPAGYQVVENMRSGLPFLKRA